MSDLLGSRSGSHGCWRPLRTGDGSYTVVHPEHGESCHSRAGAWQEARERFAAACRLDSASRDSGAPLMLLDVGTGIGLNLAAALEATERIGTRLFCVSLEKDERVLQLAVEGVGEDHGEGRDRVEEPWHATVRQALSQALKASSPLDVPMGPRAVLRLLRGDARDTLRTCPPELRFDAVFLDPFSPRVEPDLWSVEFLSEIARRMASEALLSTYSSAVNVRAALLASGLSVGPLPRVGTKSSGTIASPGADVGSFPQRMERKLRLRAQRLLSGQERAG